MALYTGAKCQSCRAVDLATDFDQAQYCQTALAGVEGSLNGR